MALYPEESNADSFSPSSSPLAIRDSEKKIALYIFNNPFRLLSPVTAGGWWLVLVQACSLFLFHLPMYYCMRAEKVFDDAQVTQTEIEDSGREYKEEKDLSASLKKFGRMWEKLVESMLKEWETTNVVAALLLSSTLTLSQISGVNGNPTLRNTSFLSLVCALMCILHGSLQLVQFGSLKTARQGLSWMEEKGKSQFEWPLMWVCIALPVLFFGASLLWFMGTIFGYMWVIDPVFKIPQHQPDYIQTCFWQTMILVYLVIGMGSWAVVLAMMYFYAVQEYKKKVVRDKGREQC